MQAIQTKYLSATNMKCPRIKAECQRGSLTIWEPKDFTSEESQRLAVKLLIEEFVADDKNVYGTPIASNPWSRPFVSGSLPDGTLAHVFVS